MTTCHCGATWTGHRIEHCPVCCQTFTGTESGDMHRTGRHDVIAGPDRRRCLAREAMRDKGMVQNARGYWQRGDAGHNPDKARRPHPRMAVVPQNDEHPSPRVVGRSEGGEAL